MEGTSVSALDWIDPFCPLLSDRIGIRPGDPPRPQHSSAARTTRALTHFSQAAATAYPVATIDGAAASLDDALFAASAMIGSWRQPVFGGLGTDVAGARALTRLALRCGAILDHAHGDSMAQALRAVQDRGGFTCTLSEIRNHADLLVCIGTDPTLAAPDFFERCGIGESVPDAPTRRSIVFLRLETGVDGAARGMMPVATDEAAVDMTPRSLRDAGATVEVLDLKGGDIHVVLAELNAACSGRKLPRAGPHWPALQALAERLQSARYGVLIHSLSSSRSAGGHSALLVEALGRIVKTLNRTTRAAAFALGAADGSATASQTATWLTGLPLRTALHARGFEHDPHRFGSRRLLESGRADGLLWVSSFSPELVPPVAAVDATPLVVLGHPAMAAYFEPDGGGDSRDGSAGSGAGRPTRIFIAVSTPGVNAPGHLFRGDGGIVLALKPFTTTTLPAVADIAQRLLGLLEARS